MRKITEREYHEALGLFSLASKHMREVERFEEALNLLLGLDEGSHVSDEIYTMGGGDIDEALKREKIAVNTADKGDE